MDPATALAALKWSAFLIQAVPELLEVDPEEYSMDQRADIIATALKERDIHARIIDFIDAGDISSAKDLADDGELNGSNQ